MTSNYRQLAEFAESRENSHHDQINVFIMCQHDDFSSPPGAYRSMSACHRNSKLFPLCARLTRFEYEGLLTGILRLFFSSSLELHQNIFFVILWDSNNSLKRTRNGIESDVDFLCIRLDSTHTLYFIMYNASPSSLPYTVYTAPNGRSRAWKLSRVEKYILFNIASLLRRRTAVKRIAQ